MPRVIQYEPNQVQRQETAAPQANLAAFDASVDFTPVVRGAGQVGLAIAKAKEEFDRTAAQDALNKFERDKNKMFFDPEVGYFNTQGRNAFDGSGEARAGLDKLKQDYASTLSGQAQRMFNEAADRHITRGYESIDRHASAGFRAFRTATIEAEVENKIENASLYWSDPDELKTQLAGLEISVIESADMTGLDEIATNEKLQTARSSFARAAITGALSSTSDAGKEVFEKYEHLLEGPDRVKMANAIAAKQKAERETIDSGVAIAFATKALREGENFGAAQQAVRDEFGDDPKMMKKAMSELRFQHNLQEAAEKDAQADAYEQAINMVNDQRMSPAQIEATNKEVWDGMSPLQRNNILAGKHMVSDQKLLADLRALPRRELKDLNASDFAGELRPADVQKLAGWIDSAQKGQSITHVQTTGRMTDDAFKSLFGKSALTSTKDSVVDTRNEFYDTVQQAIEDREKMEDRKLTPTEVKEVIKTVTQPIIEQRSGFGLDFLVPDEELTAKDIGPRELRSLNLIRDRIVKDGTMNEADAQKFIIKARQALIDSGHEPTPENVMKAYLGSQQQ